VVLIGPGLGGNVEDAAARAAILGVVEVVDDLEFLRRFD
jgi:hypothetical protein